MRRHCSWIASACALAAAFVAGTAAGQDPRLTRLPAEAQAPVGALVDSARAAGLPAEPLVQRALEGATKQAPGDLIVAAVQRLADRKSTRLNSSHLVISYAVFCLKKKKK